MVSSDLPFVAARLSAQRADRWVHVSMAALFIGVALAGFVPDSLEKLAEVEAGRRPPFAAAIHFHAVVAGTWLLLLLAQALLIARHRQDLHRRLGIAGMFLGAAVLASMVAATLDTYHAVMATGQAERIERLANTFLAQGRAIVYFSLFFLWAILVRGRDSETHKRMIVLATVVMLPAAIARINWLPTTMPQSYDALHGYMLLCLVPVLITDVVRQGRLHKAYVWGIALLLPWIIATHFLWNSPWWFATVPKLLGSGAP